MKTNPTKGMRDLLPEDVKFREQVSKIITKNYEAWGFQKIETPCIEDISLLGTGDGGENEKMIFKILKRGEKLDLSGLVAEKEIVDLGLRYDLTVPLSRFFANNKSSLIYPFKSIQIGSVWRAERPQKGRFRQFTQCDIDIIGEKDNIAEIVLLSAATDALIELGFNEFTLRINDRRFLIGLAQYFGFEENDYDSLFITLDKMDKIGEDGVLTELKEKGLINTKSKDLINFFATANRSSLTVNEQLALLPNNISDEIKASLNEIIETYSQYYNTNIVLDFGLIRGMSYYTGPIFEIEVAGFGSSVAGGGRYDGMISKFTSKEEPACGFSIGFERIVNILRERSYEIKEDKRKIVLLYSTKTSTAKILEKAKAIKQNGNIVSTYIQKKNLKNQLEVLKAEGFNYFCYADEEDLNLKPIN
ncbi:histidine--tRNA ligase [Peribacillus butanolivorans]|uniref:histidine--tRNA ligase n=1 Tax=Peribacillus butanolivorans TaxID=421767 RepID=UPI003D2BC31A